MNCIRHFAPLAILFFATALDASLFPSGKHSAIFCEPPISQTNNVKP